MNLVPIIYIVFFIFLIRKTGALARQKGLKPLFWQCCMAGAWMITGSIGYGFAMNYLGINMDPSKGYHDTMNYMATLPIKDLLIIILGNLFFAFGGYLLIRAILEKKPDNIDKDINSISSDDLRPPSNR
jgi:hypothetical protein